MERHLNMLMMAIALPQTETDRPHVPHPSPILFSSLLHSVPAIHFHSLEDDGRFKDQNLNIIPQIQQHGWILRF